MRHAMMVILVLTVEAPVLAQDEVPLPPVESPILDAPAVDVCAKISCAGHGACVVVKDQPTCACDEGYQPDSVNGLSCITVAPADQAASKEQVAETGDETTLSEIARVEEALGGINLSSHYADYGVDPMGAKSFADYMYEVYRRRKAGAVAGIVVGALCVATGFGFYFATIMSMFERDPRPFLATAISCFAMGGVTIGISVFVVLRNRRRLNKLDKLLFKQRHEISGPRFLGIAPRVGENTLGLASGFTF